MKHLSADTSPFVHQNTADPWLLWEAGEPLTALCEAEASPAASAPIAPPPDMADAVAADPPAPQIQRPQYQAVLSRMRRAVMHTGTYAAWGG